MHIYVSATLSFPYISVHWKQTFLDCPGSIFFPQCAKRALAVRCAQFQS